MAYVPYVQSQRLSAILDMLLDVEDGLTEWEVGFIDDVDKRRQAERNSLGDRPGLYDVADGVWWTGLSKRQVEALEKIYEERA